MGWWIRLVLTAGFGLSACNHAARAGRGDSDADSDSDTHTSSGTDQPCFGETCDDACVALESDPANCGECGNVCSRDRPVCLHGVCSADCAELTNCDGACSDLSTSRENCGRCGTTCRSSDRQSCQEGVCVCFIGEGLTACGDYCVDLQTNHAFCGDCGNSCRDDQVCYRGGCADDCGELTQCGRGCTDTQTDEWACGDCNITCTADSTCVDGLCLKGGGDADADTDTQDTHSDP